MKNVKPIKKGFFEILKESFRKTGGCCGAGETCDVPDKNDKVQAKEAKEIKEACKCGQK